MRSFVNGQDRLDDLQLETSVHILVVNKLKYYMGEKWKHKIPIIVVV